MFVVFGRPRRSGDVASSRGRQVETGLTIWKGAHHAGSAPDLFHDPLQRIVGFVGSNLLLVNVRKAIIGQNGLEHVLTSRTLEVSDPC